MLSIRKINPMARAIGTMGAVAALVGAVTFASLTSNTVALTDNTLASASAHLRISNDNSTYGDSASGMNFTHLVPGVTSAPFTFFLQNDGDVPLAITANIPTNFGATTIDPNKVTLAIDCGSGNTVSDTIHDFNNNQVAFAGSGLPNGTTWTCQATVTTDPSVSGGSLSPFELDFTGSQITI